MKNPDINKELRYEKKWVYNTNYYFQIINSLSRSKLKFKDQFVKRKVNTIYFDDFNLTNVINNIEGQKNRLKYRLRWYGSRKFITNPVFETKYKLGLKTYKTKKNIDIKRKVLLSDFNKVFRKIDLNLFHGKKLEPKILISYDRDYYISSDKLIRATLDTNIQYKKLNKFDPNFFHKFNNIILEMKYDTDLDSYFRNQIDNIKARYSKSSKYVNCMLTPTREFTF